MEGLRLAKKESEAVEGESHVDDANLLERSTTSDE
jgi:hypothetical protein